MEAWRGKVEVDFSKASGVLERSHLAQGDLTTPNASPESTHPSIALQSPTALGTGNADPRTGSEVIGPSHIDCLYLTQTASGSLTLPRLLNPHESFWKFCRAISSSSKMAATGHWDMPLSLLFPLMLHRFCWNSSVTCRFQIVIYCIFVGLLWQCIIADWWTQTALLLVQNALGGNPFLFLSCFLVFCVCDRSKLGTTGAGWLISDALDENTQTISQRCYFTLNSELLSEN